MKKITTLLFFFGLLAGSQQLKAQAFDQGMMFANAGITLFQTQQTPIFATFEYGIDAKVGIGAKVSYSSIGTGASSTFLGGMINWHAPSESNDALDFYTGATVGVPFVSGGGISATGSVQIIGQAGMRYFFTEQVGAFAEVGYVIVNGTTDKFLGNIGVSFKF